LEADLTKWPPIALSKIVADPEGLEKILSALKWIDDQVAHYSPS
jgi:hypothetical protein